MPEKKVRRNKNILVVESDEELAALLRSTIGDQTRYQVVRVPTGEQALRVLSTVIPDLMIFNVQLSDISGADLYARVQSVEKLKRLPLLLLGTDQTIQEVVSLSLPPQLPVFLQTLAYLLDA